MTLETKDMPIKPSKKPIKAKTTEVPKPIPVTNLEEDGEDEDGDVTEAEMELEMAKDKTEIEPDEEIEGPNIAGGEAIDPPQQPNVATIAHDDAEASNAQEARRLKNEMWRAVRGFPAVEQYVRDRVAEVGLAATLIEFACDKESMLGKVGEDRGIKVIRLSLEITDLETRAGLEHTLREIKQNPGCSMHGSLPCTPWTRWQSYNEHKLGADFRKKLGEARERSRTMLSNFRIAALEVIKGGGDVSFEWPRFCSGWDLTDLVELEVEIGMWRVNFDGCSVGVRAENGAFIKKPWTISTTSEGLREALAPLVCNKLHSHTPCAGKETKKTGFYTHQLATIILKSLFPTNHGSPTSEIMPALTSILLGAGRRRKKASRKMWIKRVTNRKRFRKQQLKCVQTELRQICAVSIPYTHQTQQKGTDGTLTPTKQTKERNEVATPPREARKHESRDTSNNNDMSPETKQESVTIGRVVENRAQNTIEVDQTTQNNAQKLDKTMNENSPGKKFCEECYERVPACVCVINQKTNTKATTQEWGHKPKCGSKGCPTDCNKEPQTALNQMVNQIGKAVRKAVAKLGTQKDSTVEIKGRLKQMVEPPRYVRDKDVEERMKRRIIEQQLEQLGHRAKLVPQPLHIMGAVTKLLSKRDPEYFSEKAKAASDKEINKLIAAGVWDEEAIERAAAARAHPAAAFSRIFRIMGIKDSEMQEGTYKARVVLQGSNVTDCTNQAIFFSDTASAPTSMACIRSTIAFGQLTGGGCSQSDAEQAYIQPLLQPDDIIFIHVPKELMTEKMGESASKCVNPVFRLRRPLYGWSRSGNIWEKHLSDTLVGLEKQAEDVQEDTINKICNADKRWKPVPNWPQTFWKVGVEGKVVILTVYVDDMILAGPGHEKEWPIIREAVRTTPPTPIARILGVHHTQEEEGTVTRTKISMTEYVKQAVIMYEAVPDAPKLKQKVSYPWYEPTLEEISDLSQRPGVFEKCSASLLMKALYCARMVRLDTCYSINQLSRFVTKWNALCDKQLCHLYSYLNNTQNTVLNAYVDTADVGEVELHGFPDADLAGSYDSTKATSGGFLCLVGNNTFFPLDWYSKRQTATSHSTTEAELVSASKMLRESLVPQMELWSILLQRPINAVVHEDNESTIAVIKNGYSPQLRHLAKHHRISLGIVHEMSTQPDIEVRHCPTKEQKGDLLTKGLNRQKHEEAARMVGLYYCIVIGDDCVIVGGD